jgi:transcriptional regulator with GAF, ATPase, and Fis domain
MGFKARKTSNGSFRNSVVSQWLEKYDNERTEVRTWSRHGVHGLLLIASDIPAAVGAAAARPVISKAHADRRDRLEALLREYEGNVSAVARIMDTYPIQIRRWARRYGIDIASYRTSF